MRANTIRERWTDRRPATNAWCSIGSPYSAEILAASGYDAVTVDLQHGMFGVDAFTPIINSPEAGILGVNRIRDDVAWEGDKPVKQQRMRLSLTWDHRVVDGAPAAEFLGTVRDLLEAPYRLLV